MQINKFIYTFEKCKKYILKIIYWEKQLAQFLYFNIQPINV